MKARIAIAVVAFAQATLGWAQSLPSNNTTNFGMIGLVRGQTLQINLVAIPPDPCSARLGFQNSAGEPVGPTLSVALQPGQSASLALNGDTLTNVPGQRVEVLSTVVPVTLASSAFVNQCDATAEVFDNTLEISSVVVPGQPGFAAAPEFGMLGVTGPQTARLNVVAYPPDPCNGTLSFVDSAGVPVGDTRNVQLAPGQAAFLELPGSTLVTKLGQRAEVRPVVTAPDGGCIASTEVYLNRLGATSVYFPPDPCGPLSASCVAF